MLQTPMQRGNSADMKGPALAYHINKRIFLTGYFYCFNHPNNFPLIPVFFCSAFLLARLERLFSISEVCSLTSAGGDVNTGSAEADVSIVVES